MSRYAPGWRRHVLTAWLVVFTLLTAWALWSSDRAVQEGEKAHTGLCAMKADLERRVQASRDYLRANPLGAPGIPASVIRNSIRNQELTADALEDAELECEEAN